MMVLKKKIIISPPFGNYIEKYWAQSVKGTYSLYYRPGLIKNVLKSVRKIPGGYRNKVGLRNKGIGKVNFNPDYIYSLVGFSDEEWAALSYSVPSVCTVELNVSCPNLEGEFFDIPREVLRNFATRHNYFVIMKLPPNYDRSYEFIEKGLSAGISWFHLSNTVWSPKGGLSGESVFEYNMEHIPLIQKAFPSSKIIGGGGIYSDFHLQSYLKLGVQGVSLSSIWFTPWKAQKLNVHF